MSINTFNTDLHEILTAHAEHRQVASEVARRVRERADKVRGETFQKHGVLNVAVQLIREARDEA